MTVTRIPETAKPFFEDDDHALCQAFLDAGHVIRPAADRSALDRIQNHVAGFAASELGLPTPSDATDFLDRIHEHVNPDKLNDFRLAVIRDMNDQPWLRPAYFAVARDAVEAIVGNEVAMQRRVNLSIQMPDDDSSVLPVHADVWSGDSPYEAVLWIPLVSCFGTKTMFLAPPKLDGDIQRRFKDFDGRSAEDLYHEIEPDLTFLDIPYGHYILFNQNLMHGNRVNREGATRWSMNCRFKSAMSPYADKKLGEFFEPVTLRPMTRIGMEYSLPTGFEE